MKIFLRDRYVYVLQPLIKQVNWDRHVDVHHMADRMCITFQWTPLHVGLFRKWQGRHFGQQALPGKLAKFRSLANLRCSLFSCKHLSKIWWNPPANFLPVNVVLLCMLYRNHFLRCSFETQQEYLSLFILCPATGIKPPDN